CAKEDATWADFDSW
nr:immunoglobulin heavy chain junction region [Macaca mulatta]MOW75134.1 immunoglobulin heavy chain junction region [Macaca mulatta]MOW75151.1 immunoglobulin heavy chain junction region [Macaca mulatta]MOW75163.1 immunoglobulin heavy chain junction region [Macaca mulatta]MOW75202.1 immunoglobulin heavy chain junction region [Macaca mulatta]